MAALLPNASFILKPYLDRLASQNTASQKGVLHQVSRSFFKKSTARFVFLRVEWTRLQPGQIELAQPFADRPVRSP